MTRTRSSRDTSQAGSFLDENPGSDLGANQQLVFLVPWGGGHWLAASLIGGGEWQAGTTLMQEARPAAWERVVQLNNACPPDRTTEACVVAMAGRGETAG